MSRRAKDLLKKADDVPFETEVMGGWRDNPALRNTRTN